MKTIQPTRPGLLLALAAALVCGDVFADVTVDTAQVLGPVKPMHGVNNGPIKAPPDQTRGNYPAYAAAKIPFARTHDSSFQAAYGGEHTVDVTAIFPDFSKDPNDPASYDFVVTDHYLKSIREAGTEVFYRLGQKIEHGVKKYGTVPPPDFAKWAVICEHIIRHYNKGWTDGFRWNIRYWEIWNEADLDRDDSKNKRCWGGTEAQFFEFFRIAAKHLKKCFPDLKIGGPALAGNLGWADRFLASMAKDDRVPLDFFSWHIYCTKPSQMTDRARQVRELMKKHGYEKAESILNEWNYVRGWSSEFVYSIRTIIGQKGAAFTAACMCACQDAPVDILMYYDARPTAFNGLFDYYTFAPLKGYYPFLAWSKLAALGMEASCAIMNEKDIYAAAAANKDGKLAILVCRYSDDDNVQGAKPVTVRLKEGSLEGARCTITDSSFTFTEIPAATENGALELMLEPNAFVLIER